jgi:hypothetical protein
MSYAIENGLIVGSESGQCAGYIFNFGERGAFDPTGLVQVGDLRLTQEQVDAHNKILGDAEIQAMRDNGKGLLYFYYTRKPECTLENPRWKIEQNGGFTYSDFKVSNWCGSWKVSAYARRSLSAAFGGPIDRWDVWFTGPDGKQWYGVNKGDNQILRARRLKGRKEK